MFCRYPCQWGSLLHADVGSTLVCTCACILSACLENQYSRCNFDRGFLRTALKSHSGDVSWFSQRCQIWLERRMIFFFYFIIVADMNLCNCEMLPLVSKKSFGNQVLCFSTQAIAPVWGRHFLSRSHDFQLSPHQDVWHVVKIELDNSNMNNLWPHLHT